MERFISEPIVALGGSFDVRAMAAGMPGLPPGFVWRGQEYRIGHVREQWKQTSAEGGRAGGEVYLRRHYFRLEMNDGSEWTVYFVRQTPRSGRPTRRWFLYSLRPPG